MENTKFKIMRRDIEILRELVIDFVLPEQLLDRILILEQSRTRYLNPASLIITEEEGEEQTGQDDDWPDYR